MSPAWAWGGEIALSGVSGGSATVRAQGTWELQLQSFPGSSTPDRLNLSVLIHEVG